MATQVSKEGITQISAEQQISDIQYINSPFTVPGQSHSHELILGYRRSLDFDADDKPGQDYATFRCGQGYVVGVVADGVSQSFYGDLAAHYIAKAMIKALWHHRLRPPKYEQISKWLKDLEKRFASEVVARFKIPINLMPMLRENLEVLRARQGSQAVFAAFLLDTARNHLYLYQVGDIEVIIHYPDRPPALLQAPPKGRWSSAGKSKLELATSFHNDIQGIVLKTDGAGKDWGMLLEGEALGQKAFKTLAEQRAGIDDLAFIAVRHIGRVAVAAQPQITPLHICTDDLPDARAGTFYTAELAIEGGMPPYQWGLEAGSVLPEGLTLSPAGMLSGVVPAGGVAAFSLQATDATQTVANKTLALFVAAAPTVNEPSSPPAIMAVEPVATNYTRELFVFAAGTAAGIGLFAVMLLLCRVLGLGTNGSLSPLFYFAVGLAAGIWVITGLWVLLPWLEQNLSATETGTLPEVHSLPILTRRFASALWHCWLQPRK